MTNASATRSNSSSGKVSINNTSTSQPQASSQSQLSAEDIKAEIASLLEGILSTLNGSSGDTSGDISTQGLSEKDHPVGEHRPPVQEMSAEPHITSDVQRDFVVPNSPYRFDICIHIIRQFAPNSIKRKGHFVPLRRLVSSYIIQICCGLIKIVLMTVVF